MILIIAGSDRNNSNTRKVANHVYALMKKNGADAEILDLADLKPASSHGGPHYGDLPKPEAVTAALAKVNSADGIYMCIPEYNGSFPGALKYFIDHWKFPDSFEFRPFALCGLGYAWGGLRPVEHMQGVLGYRNAFVYPERVFVRDIGKAFNEQHQLKDAMILDLFEKQVAGFISFLAALKHGKLDANSRRPS